MESCFTSNTRCDFLKEKNKVAGYIFQLDKDPKYVDDYFKLYKNVVRDGFLDVIEEISPDISITEFLQLATERFLVYEIFDYMETRKKVELVNILIYYPHSRLCFVYKAKLHCHVMLFGFYFSEIIRNITKDELDNMFLHKQRTAKHEKIVNKEPHRVSNIMNPDGYVEFVNEMRCNLEDYVNRTNKPYPVLNLKFFRNYLWIHYCTMSILQRQTLREQVKIAQETLENRKDLHPELIEYIFCFLK